MHMRVGIFVNPKRPKVSQEKIAALVRSAGLTVSRDPEIAIVVGGDGTFGYYGRKLSIPMLFVAVGEQEILGSKARLSEVTYAELGSALKKIAKGDFAVEERNMLCVEHDGKTTDVLTDVYMERSVFAGCIRYTVSVEGPIRFTEYAIGNGVIISTSFGSGGYYSYPERISLGEWTKKNPSGFEDDRIGICHIIPTYLSRKQDGQTVAGELRYTVPFTSRIMVSLSREANGRLYGTTAHHSGVRIKQDGIVVRGSHKKARVIRIFHGKD